MRGRDAGTDGTFPWTYPTASSDGAIRKRSVCPLLAIGAGRGAHPLQKAQRVGHPTLSLADDLWKTGAEFAGAEGFEGAEAGGECRGRETTFAEEAAQEVCGRLVGFACVAFDTAGDEVAIGVAAGMHLRDDMVEALGAFFQAAEAVEARVALTGIDGAAQ